MKGLEDILESLVSSSILHGSRASKAGGFVTVVERVINLKVRFRNSSAWKCTHKRREGS